MNPPGVVAGATAEPPAIRLAERVRLTLAIEGPAPLEVDWPPPSELLSELAATNWDLTLARPAAVEALPGRAGWERASVAYDASPRRPGSALPLGFRPVSVRSGPGARAEVATPPNLSVDVTASVTADLAQLRPGSGFAAPAEAPTAPEWPAWPGPAALAALLAAGAFGVWRLVRRPRPAAPADGFARRLADLRADSASPGAEWAARLSEWARDFLHAAHGVPARERTTGELGELLAGRPLAGAASELLSACDRVRYAGEELSEPARRELARLAESLSRAHGPKRSAG